MTAEEKVQYQTAHLIIGLKMTELGSSGISAAIMTAALASNLGGIIGMSGEPEVWAAAISHLNEVMEDSAKNAYDFKKARS